MNGILLINKEKGYTSRDVVNVVSKHLKTKKVGHTGTLDPLATGVLVICVGNATKLVDIITSTDKEYVAQITLGLATDTLDITGLILKEENACISKDRIMEVLNNMTGEYDQEVPIYSAVKINGKKLYQYARNNEKIILPKRLVNIKELKLIGEVIYQDNKTIFSIRCLVSKGTYIRSLASDIASKLNTIGVMSELSRTKQGIIKIEDCIKLNELEKGNYHLIDIRDCLPAVKQVITDEVLEKEISNGSIIKNIYDANEILFINSENRVLALYHVYEENDIMLKPWKMFK